MKIYLTKQNRKTTDFILLEADDRFVRSSSGKVGKSGIANSTLNAGSAEKAILEINIKVDEYKKQGYILANLPTNIASKDIVFDKAKWHINENFPQDLNHYHSYIHTGLYVAWLIDKNLLVSDFATSHSNTIQKHIDRKISPSKFYETALDGVFDAEGLTEEAIKFTSDYFNFETGEYLNDYTSLFDPDNKLPSLFHVEDTWDNYSRLKVLLDKKFDSWKNKG